MNREDGKTMEIWSGVYRSDHSRTRGCGAPPGWPQLRPWAAPIPAVETGDGDDTVIGRRKGNETIYAGNGNNIVLADNGAVVTLGDIVSTVPEHGGTDRITTGSGDDIIIGGSASDTPSVPAPATTSSWATTAGWGARTAVVTGILSGVYLNGTSLSGTASLGDSDTSIDAGDGDDVVIGGKGNETVIAGTGNDVVLGDNGVVGRGFKAGCRHGRRVRHRPDPLGRHRRLHPDLSGDVASFSWTAPPCFLRHYHDL